MDADTSQSVEVGVDPPTAFALYTGVAEIGRGYGEGAKELLGWYAEAAAAPDRPAQLRRSGEEAP
jgi:hypothetical protein